jgi:hypothetical protein
VCSAFCKLRRPPPPDHQAERNRCGNDQEHQNSPPYIDSCAGLGFPGVNFLGFFYLGWLNLYWLNLGWLDLDWLGLEGLCYLWLRILHWHREACLSLSIAFCNSSCKHLQGADFALTEGIWPS